MSLGYVRLSYFIHFIITLIHLLHYHFRYSIAPYLSVAESCLFLYLTVIRLCSEFTKPYISHLVYIAPILDYASFLVLSDSLCKQKRFVVLQRTELTRALSTSNCYNI